MKSFIRIASLCLFIIHFSNLFAQDQKDSIGVIQVNSSDFLNLIQNKKGILLDVRTNSEYSAEHIEGAGQLNFYALDFKKKLELLPKDQALYLYCNTGYRSNKAAEYLVKKSYKQVYNLEHGIMEWNLNELPVIEGDKSLLGKENMMSPGDFTEIIKSDTLVFIDFYAPWCAPCKKMMPMIDSLKTEYHQKVKIVKINADISKKLVKELKLTGVPYFMLYKKNEKLYENSGSLKRRDIVSIFRKYSSE